MIRVRGVSKRFRGRLVLDRVDLEVPNSRVVVVLGPTGIGKSVLLRVMAGLLRPDQGAVEYDGIPLRFDLLSDNRLILAQLGFVFQGGALFDSLNVADNVALPLRETSRLSPGELGKQVMAALERVGMERCARLFPRELSGGMTRLVAIARALAGNPRYLFFDEPTTALDPVTRERILKLIAGLRDQEGKTEVAVTHDLEAAERIADRIYMLKESRAAILDRAGKEHYEASYS